MMVPAPMQLCCSSAPIVQPTAIHQTRRAAPAGYAQLFSEAVERLQGLGGTPVTVDFSPFAEVMHHALITHAPWNLTASTLPVLQSGHLTHPLQGCHDIHW
jgi:hypothetical protein